MTQPTVRSRAPLRLGLAGGGTDLSPYCDQHGGAVLNSTIARYAHATIAPSPDGLVRFRATDIDTEEVFPADPAAVATAKLAIHAGVWRRMINQFCGGVPRAWTITTQVDAPPGSGLGSSSALAVAMVEAFRTVLGLPLGLYDVAHLAYEIERVDLGLAGGKQDQYAAAFGGTNFMEFLAGDRVIVNPLRVTRAYMNELESALVTCFTGVSRRSEQIIEEQQRLMAAPKSAAVESLHQMKQDAIDMKQALLRGEIGQLAAILHRSWIAKQRTASGVSSERIEALFQVAMASGASAGKVSGAGGGGFIMFLAPPRSPRRADPRAERRRRNRQPGPIHRPRRGVVDRAGVDLGTSLASEARALPWTRWGRRPQTPFAFRLRRYGAVTAVRLASMAPPRRRRNG